MGKVSQNAYSRFESKLAEREEPGRQLSSVRALFDLWIDAAEEAFAECALSPEYRQVYGAMVNAQMQLRSGIQAMAEQAAGQLGMPGRTELDSAHRKIAELERQMRRMQRRSEESAPAPTPAAKPATKATSPKPPVKTASTPASKPAKKAAAKTATKKVVKPAARKPAKPASRKR